MSVWCGGRCTLHPTPGREGRSDAAPLQRKFVTRHTDWQQWELARRLGFGFAGPGADEGHPSDNRICGGNLGLEPIWQSVEVT